MSNISTQVKGESSKQGEHSSPGRHIRKVAVRWKLLAAFATAFTVVFVFIALFVLQFSTQNAQTRLETDLLAFALGGASTIDSDQFVELITTVEAVPDPTNPFGFGYPDSELYREQAKTLVNINTITGEALSYSYFKDPVDGQLYASASSGYYLDPQIGYTFKVPIAETSGVETNALMEKGLTEPTLQPAYSDGYGSWISQYVPILDENGNSVGGVGVDYPLAYVDAVERDVRLRLLPILIGSYVILLAMVLGLSTTLVRPLKRLTVATARIADGEYDLNVRGLVTTRFPDEMYDLAESIAVMAGKVEAREKSLTQEVQRLKVEIDHGRRAESVKEITESDSFAELAVKAAALRKRMHEGPGKD
jgi:methyl-accepting chemotaxis protein